ncbi:MAG: hypothetical protein JO126_02430 [Alphaproteobacteria bacterium]|nr:hypothetical protein [Alphaproteobacteria bacterium]
MNKVSVFCAGIAACLLLTSCSHQVWVKPGSTQQDFSTDNYACMQSAMASAPVTVANTAAWSGGGGNANWNSAGGNANWNGGGGQVRAKDMNQTARNQLMNACLQAKGWQLTTVKDQ